MRTGILIVLALVGAWASSSPRALAKDETLPPPRVIKRSRGQVQPTLPSTARPTPLPPVSPSQLPPWQPVVPQPARGTLPVRPSDPLTQRGIQQRVDDYLRGDGPLIAPTSLPGAASYEQGFGLRTAGFRLKLNLILQARYEAFLYDGTAPAPGGDLSGFSLPRAVLRLSGTSEPNFRYFLELDFGNNGGKQAWRTFRGCLGCKNANLGPDSQNEEFDVLREAWIEWRGGNMLNARAGLLRTPASRQLMVQPELQQFADISLASAWTGLGMPGYTDRNRDYGVLLHGFVAGRPDLVWLFSVTNGDGGDSVRNVIDQRSSDNLAYAARVNWAFLDPIGYQEGALRQLTNRWYGELGVWGMYYADRVDGPHTGVGDYLRYGVDLALGYGGLSLTGGVSFTDDSDVLGVNDDESTAWLAQVGYHFLGTAWELAARWSGVDTSGDLSGNGTVQEVGLGLNYYLNGHGSKLQLDATYIDTDAGGFLILDPYAAYPGNIASGDSAWLVRFQWQLAL